MAAILTKQHLFIFTKIVGKLHILHDLKGKDDKLGIIFDKVMCNLELVEDDIDQLLVELFPEKDIEELKKLDMMSYLLLINQVYVDNKDFFLGALGGLTGQKN